MFCAFIFAQPSVNGCFHALPSAGAGLPSHFSTPVFTSAGLDTSRSSSFQLLCGLGWDLSKSLDTSGQGWETPRSGASASTAPQAGSLIHGH